MARQPVPRRENQSALLGLGDAGGGTAKVGAGATAHLDKHGSRSVAADEVDLAAFDAKIARQHNETVRSKILGSSGLGSSAA